MCVYKLNVDGGFLMVSRAQGSLRCVVWLFWLFYRMIYYRDGNKRRLVGEFDLSSESFTITMYISLATL